MKDIFNQFKESFESNSNPIHHFFAPGRLNLIGEHLDYNGGTVMPYAIELGIDLLIQLNDSGKIAFKSTAFDEKIAVDLDEKLTYQKENSWANYPIGILKFLKEKGLKCNGANLLFKSNLPIGSGLSSSACVEVLTAFALNDLFDLKLDLLEIAKLGKKVENDFIGVNCGLMDQFAVAFGKANNLIELNNATFDYSYIPFNLETHEIVIINSNSPRRLESSEYNNRKASCDNALQLLQQNYDIKNLAEAKPQMLQHIKDEKIFKRTKHVIEEEARVQKMKNAIANNDLKQFFNLINASQKSLKEYFEVTGPILDAIHNIAVAHSACNASRMTGGGFGGCSLAVVEKQEIKKFENFFLETYFETTGIEAEIYGSKINNGVLKVN